MPDSPWTSALAHWTFDASPVADVIQGTTLLMNNSIALSSVNGTAVGAQYLRIDNAVEMVPATTAQIAWTADVSNRFRIVGNKMSHSIWMRCANSGRCQGILQWGRNGYLRVFDGGAIRMVVYHNQGGNETESPAHPWRFDGLWHHLVGVYDGNEVRLYLDCRTPTCAPHFSKVIGSWQLDNPINEGAFPSLCGFQFGGRCGGQNTMRGMIDDYMIFGRALTTAEIVAIGQRNPALAPPPAATPNPTPSTPSPTPAVGVTPNPTPATTPNPTMPSSTMVASTAPIVSTSTSGPTSSVALVTATSSLSPSATTTRTPTTVPMTVETTVVRASSPTFLAVMGAENGALVGGIVGGVVVGVLLLGAIVGFLLWRLKRASTPVNGDAALKPAHHYIAHAADFKVEEGPRYDSQSNTDEAGATLSVDAVGAAAPSDQYDSPPAPGKSALSARSSSKHDSEFASARVDATWSIDESDVELGSVIGQGAYGVVRRGEWHGRTVAVKQIKKSTIGDDKAVADFEREIGRMALLQAHENVVRFYGVVELASGEIGAVVEFCAQGALVDALYGEKARELSRAELLQIAYDAACGVTHLHANKIVHRDIAARNVLLAGKKDLAAKVCDFGMARDIDSVYSGIEQQTKQSIGPVKWMAPEQLERMAYSKASDVFAFGVLLYEIFARSAPWPGLANVNVMLKVAKGERMDLPPTMPAKVRKITRHCWAHEPKERWTMQDVSTRIASAQKPDADP